ncbi:MAG: hypothetical protein ISS71_02850 [Phycisphaerae bacterium]|nr:hypothetical protein [Phycisphaerae bacterium]
MMEENYPRFYDDDGTEVNPGLIAKPALCVSCKKDGLRNEEILCDLNRMDQQDSDEFICEAYEPKDSYNQDEAAE